MNKIPSITWCNHEFHNLESRICFKCKRAKPRNNFNSLDFGKRVTGKRITKSEV
jgi:hypothetical protein